jgi:hypothetical protein
MRAALSPRSGRNASRNYGTLGAALTKARAARKMILVLPRFGPTNAQVAELADALDSGSSDRKVVEVRILSWAPTTYEFLDFSKVTFVT